VPLRIVREQPDRPVAVPEPERLRLVLALAVRELDLQDDAAGRDGARRERVLERLLELEPPSFRALENEIGQAREPRAACLGLLEPG